VPLTGNGDDFEPEPSLVDVRSVVTSYLAGLMR
jgi:hypothetical protein